MSMDLTDVEETYRRQYREALITLGREPTTHDEVYWTIGDTYRRDVEAAVRTIRATTTIGAPVGLSRGLSEEEGGVEADPAPSREHRCQDCGTELSPPVRENGKLKGRPPKKCETCRGKREGVTGQVELRTCEECGKMWERKRARGRPHKACPGCRGER